jgi:hypothetical protein
LPFAQKAATIHPPAPVAASAALPAEEPESPEHHAPGTSVRSSSSNGTSDTIRHQFNPSAANGHDPKAPAASRRGKPAASVRPAARRASEVRPNSARPGSPRPSGPARPGSSRTQNRSRSAASSRWNGAKNGKHNGAHSSTPASNGSRPTSSSSRVTGSNGTHRNGKVAGPAWTKRTGNPKGVKAVAKTASARKDARPPARKSRPTLASAGRSGTSAKRFFSNRGKQGTKKRG